MNTSTLCLTLACGWSLAAALMAQAQPEDAAEHGFRQQTYTREHGLPSSTIRALLQTRDGFLWISTDRGVARFDGRMFTVFNRNTHAAFASDDCTALAEGPDGSLWIGTTKGALRFRDGRFTRFGKEEGLQAEWVANLLTSSSGLVWVQSWSGLEPVGIDLIQRDHVTKFSEVRMSQNGKSYGPRVFFEDRQGFVWFSEGADLYCWRADAGRSAAVSVPGRIDPLQPISACEMPDGSLLFSQGGKDFYAREAGVWKTIEPFPGPHLIPARGGGGLWVAEFVSPFRLWFRSPDGGTHLVAAPSEFGANDSDPVRCFLEDREGNLWFGCDQSGLHRWQPRRTQTYTSQDGLAGDLVYALHETRDGSMWVGTETGLSRFQNGQITNYTHSERRRNIVRSLAEDAEGNLWIGTLGQGVDCFRDGRFTHSPAQEPTPSPLPGGDLATDVTKEAPLLGGAGGGFLGTMRDKISRRSLPGELPGNKVRALEVGRDGGLWIGTAGGLHWLRNGAIATWTTTNGIPHNEVCALHEDRSGRLWLGTEGGGLALFHLRSSRGEEALTFHSGIPAPGSTNDQSLLTSAATVRLFTTTTGLPSDRVWALHEDADGILWIGTERGLARVDLSWLGSTPAPGVVNGAPAVDSPENSRRTDSRYAQGEVRREGASNGTRGARAPRAENNQSLLTSAATITSFTKAHGLYEETINEIIEDDFGRLWLASDRGIMRVDKRELNAVAAGRTNRFESVVYSESDGLLSQECNGQKSQPAACKTRDGRLWFATTKGVAIIDPRKLDELDTRPPVLIERIIVDGETIFENLPGFQLPANQPTPSLNPPLHPSKEGNLQPGSQTKLPSSEGPGVGSRTVMAGAASSQRRSPERRYELQPGRGRVLEIHYTAPTFKAPEKVRFRYRLSGFDHAWTEAETRRVAYYTSLQPGAYRFEVLAANNHSVWSEQAAGFAFTLAPHYWQTRWFQPACWSGALAAFAGVVLLMRRVHRIRQQGALLEERARIARDMHDALGSQLSQVGLALASPKAGEPAQGSSASQLLINAERTLDEIVWTMKSAEDRLDRLAIYLAQHGHEHVSAAGLEFEMDLPEVIPAWPLSAPVRKEILLACKEALTNAIRHAQARKITLRLVVESTAFVIEISDDGVGFEMAQLSTPAAQPSVRRGNGLANMRQRIEACRGRFEITSQLNHGTKVHFQIPRPL